LVVLDLALGAASNDWRGVEIWVLVLFAEYAATIRTIPPEEKRSRKAKRSEAGIR
jgi:hypothetical protein